MADFTDFIIQILIWAGFAVVLASPLIAIVFLRDRMKWWPGRQVYDIEVYNLKPGKKLDATGHAKEEDCELSWTSVGWRLKHGKIPWCYVQTDGMRFQGFEISAAAFALIRRYEKPTIRLVEISQKLKMASNFIFLDVPESLDPQQITQAISYEGVDMRDGLRNELTRPQVDDLWKAVLLPIAAMVVAVLIIVLTLQYSSGQFNQTVSAGTTYLGQVCQGWADQNHLVPLNQTKPTPMAPPATNNIIPFQTTG